MSKKISLEEATLKVLSQQLNIADNEDMVDGIVDNILVAKDPEINSDEYNELMERADEIQEDIPQGVLPYHDDWLNQYALRCPICGSTFISKDVLEDGTECPICDDIPESFIVVGKLVQDETQEEQEDNDLGHKVNIDSINEENEDDSNVEEIKDTTKILIKQNPSQSAE